LAETEEAVETVETVATWLQFATRGKKRYQDTKAGRKKRWRLHRMSRLFRMPLPPLPTPFRRLCIPPFDAQEQQQCEQKELQKHSDPPSVFW